jgi:hypothetical protein
MRVERRPLALLAALALGLAFGCWELDASPTPMTCTY